MSLTRTMSRLEGGALALLGLVALIARPAPAQPSDPPPAAQTQQSAPSVAVSDAVIIHFRDGRRLEGTLVRQDTAEVVVRIAGIDTPLNRNDIVRVDPVPPVEEHYRRLRAVIRDDDIEQLLVLADWLRDREAYALALEELAHILEVDPANSEARSLKLQVEGQIKLRLESARRSRGEQPGDDPAPRIHRPEFPVLTPDQINLLKVYEVDLGDPPRLAVDRQTVQELMDAYAGHELIPQSREGRAALERRPANQILELMFRLKARDFYGRVQVEEEPRAFKLFRENVHRAWLINSCASNACHGGQQAGRLWLNNVNQNAERTVYTNFLILERYRLADGTPLINYEEPAASPLLQMALPREESLYPHPLVKTSRTAAWRPVIGSVDDQRFHGALAWINAMYRPRPEYPVSYKPPAPAEGVPTMPNTPIGER
jgi:hypothetical protein